MYVFWVLCIAEIIAGAFAIEAAQYAVKPLLIPCLIFLFINEIHPSNKSKNRMLIIGLVFCWIGDVLLMFEERGSVFFILGLASFLCGHLFYIFYLSKLSAQPGEIKQQDLLMLLPVAAYVSMLLYLLYPSLGSLKIPVTMYAVVLAGMLSMALRQLQKIDFKTAQLFVAGATSFVLSDSLLALNKFYHSFAQAGFLIMFTYCLAQYLIVSAAIKYTRLQK